MVSDISFEEWLVPRRSEIQAEHLRLLKIMRARKEFLSKIRYNQAMTALVTGIGFSLWRAVFIAENKKGQSVFDDAEDFLGKIILDNAIMYKDDKNDYSFGYYTESARASLIEFCRLLPPAFRKGKLADMVERLADKSFFDLKNRMKYERLLSVYKQALTTFEWYAEGGPKETLGGGKPD